MTKDGIDMAQQMVTASFRPSGIEVKVPLGINALTAAIEAGIQVNAVCGGKGKCGKCRAKVVQGRLSKPSSAEAGIYTEQELEQGWLLLCQRTIQGDVVLEANYPTEKGNSFMPTKGNPLALDFEIDSPVLKTYHELPQPTIEDQTADLDRVLSELSGEVKVQIEAVRQLPDVLLESRYRVTSVLMNDRLITLEKGDTSSQIYGIAIDIGTTSVAGYLLDMRDGRILASASAANRQRVHGADVISRITYFRENENGLARLHKLVHESIDEVILQLLKQSKVAREHVYAVTLIGNTVMSHLVMGVSPIGVASSPFNPAFARSLSGSVGELGLQSLPAASQFILLPNIAGYVGSDTVGVILATELDRISGNWLAIDIGTNGEIALASNGRILTCSTAAGPAFEGASISQGMRAEPGAIIKVVMDEDVHLEIIGEEEPQGISGSGLIDAVAEMVKLGLLRANGRIKSPEECPPDLPEKIKQRIVPSDNGTKFLLTSGRNEVAITQKDISELQLGKGAIRAGIEILMETLGITAEQLDGILVAGAFGSNLKPSSIQGIGMFPPVELSKIKSVGNAAGTGAIMALLSKKKLKLASVLSRNVEHIELSLHTGFSRKFAKAIRFEL